jgi:hypothetical protein
MYAAAVVSVDDEQCRIIVREVYQDPSQEGRPSFPTSASATTDTFRSYTRARLIRADKEESDDEALDDEWEEPEAGEGGTTETESRVSIEDVEQEEDFEEEEEE